jgi:hypothetical protein
MRQNHISFPLLAGLLWTGTLTAAQIDKVRGPEVQFLPAPLAATVPPSCDQSVLLGRSSAQANLRFDYFRYTPLEDGGFELADTKYRWPFNRAIISGRNLLLTGDLPTLKVLTTTGSGVYPRARDRSFPLFSRPDALQAQGMPSLGTLTLGVVGPDGEVQWLHQQADLKTRFRPGYTTHEVTAPDGAWRVTVTFAPTRDFHGFIARVESARPLALAWQYGGLYWEPKEADTNRVRLTGNRALLTEPNLPRGQVWVGWDGDGEGVVVAGKRGEEARFQSRRPQKVHHIVGVWGVTDYDPALARTMMARLDTPNSARWPKERDRLKQAWFDCYIGRALHPGQNFARLLRRPARELERTRRWWDQRRAEFQIRTPDPYLNALVNFERCISEYHRMGPGLVLSSQRWMMYSHISVGWYGKIWAGDPEIVAEYLRLFAALQQEDGYIRWISPSLAPYSAENNTPYWVDQVAQVYAWTGDRRFVRDLWPSVRRAVAGEQKNNDPDGDGLFLSKYEYWNCDSDGSGPKSPTPTSTAWAMYHQAARLAAVAGDIKSATRYRQQAEKIRAQALRVLWNESEGVLGSIGGEGVWRSHPQTWEQYIGILNGLLPADKGRRAMRWLEAHYGFEPEPGIKLLMSCDAWPIRWSVHWVPVGDSLLAAMAGMQCGDTALWWPYFQTVVRSAFRNDAPAVRFGISNTGSGSAGIEFVDADDPHMYATVRGLFGIVPDVPDDRLYITPAFPADWRTAEIRLPLVHYTWQRQGDRATLTIETPRPLIKVVRAGPGAPAVTTPKETRSVVTLDVTAIPPAPPISRGQPPVLVEREPRPPEPRLPESARRRLVLLDLSEIYNTTLRELVRKTSFTTDYGTPTTIAGWWHTVSGRMDDGPERVTADNGVEFLLKGRAAAVRGEANNLVALSSWGRKYPLPAGIKIPVNRKLERFWLLMQNYVSPVKNYIPNGEIILKYRNGRRKVISLVPPYNLDCYFQAFSREGTSVKLGALEWTPGWSPCSKEFCHPQALALPVACNPAWKLETIEIRATVTEGVLGIAALTLLPAE